MNGWAQEEMATADLGDRRLDGRLAAVLERLGNHPRISIPAETVAAYCFLGNAKATFDGVPAPTGTRRSSGCGRAG